MISACSFNNSLNTGNAVYRGFSLVATRPQPIDLTWRSAIKSLDSLKISITKRKHNSDKAVLIGVTREDNSAKIYLRKIDNNTTRISIRVGVFGDPAMSQEILRRIDQNLELLKYELTQHQNYTY